jgi:hypothetical protein
MRVEDLLEAKAIALAALQDKVSNLHQRMISSSKVSSPKKVPKSVKKISV